MKHVACKNLINFCLPFFLILMSVEFALFVPSGNVKNDVMLKMLLGVVVMVISTQHSNDG